MQPGQSPSKATSPKQDLAKMKQSLGYHMAAIGQASGDKEREEAAAAPIFTATVFQHFQEAKSKSLAQPFSQYGLLGGASKMLAGRQAEGEAASPVDQRDPRLFVNLSHPLSVFICGSQGSGKSHTLSCLLENCLIPSKLNHLPHPLTGLVFHYDTFISDNGGSPCEATYLSSDTSVKVRVLCSPTNVNTIRRTYSAFKVQVEPLYIDEAHLNTKRMLDLMAIKQEDGPAPLYIQVVLRILREMRIEQQSNGVPFSYTRFKKAVLATALTPPQRAPLEQRLETLESFMVPLRPKSADVRPSDWSPKARSLTIVDLSCPCITPEAACAMFNICLSIFLEQDMVTGRVVALDEAHKYMNASVEADAFTETLLSTIRLQRHLGARIFISTQEPTVSPALLDLSSAIIVHRFTSPQWLRTLRDHLAPIASNLILKTVEEEGQAEQASADYSILEGSIQHIFDGIVKLRVGEALIFSPSAMVGMVVDVDKGPTVRRLGFGYVKAKIRNRLTLDGGRSVLAV